MSTTQGDAILGTGELVRTGLGSVELACREHCKKTCGPGNSEGSMVAKQPLMHLARVQL